MRKQKPQQGLFYKLARKTSEAVGSPIASLALASLKENCRSYHNFYLGDYGAIFRFLRYVAISDQYWDDNYHVSDGFPNSKLSK